MSLVSNLKNVFALTSVLFLFTACGGGSGGSASSSVADVNGDSTTISTATMVSTSTPTTSTSTTSTPAAVSSTPTATTPAAKAIHSGQVKDSSTGNGLVNVKVSLGESTTRTDENGFYTLSDLITSEEVVINFEKEGYLLGSAQIQLKSLSGDNTTSSNYLEYGMRAHKYQWDYDSTGEIAGAHIDIDTSVAYTDTEGKPYNGTIAAKLTILDITSDEGKAVFPGAFKGINTNGEMVQFDSYGLVSISLQDSNGDSISLADDEIATLGFDAVTSLEKPDILPLWYYDYDQGLWVEEGHAELQEDGSYKGEVSHLGTWSLNRSLEATPGIYRGRILYADGTPAQDIRIHAVGNNWSSSDLSTDEDGIFEVQVIPGSSFQLKAYDYQNKYGANYNGIIAAIASGDIVEDRM